ncbi:unnamed protein product, partial [Lampetra fluviatilis]
NRLRCLALATYHLARHLQGLTPSAGTAQQRHVLAGQGQSFATMWKSFVKDLNAGQLVDLIFNVIGGDSLRLVIINEVSMMRAAFLVLLDQHLRSMYNPRVVFGGISILLVGDFIQLPVTCGRDLYRVMYDAVSSEDLMARSLFERFHQPNGYDCGVYTLLNIWHLVRHYNIVAVQGPGQVD